MIISTWFITLLIPHGSIGHTILTDYPLRYENDFITLCNRICMHYLGSSLQV